jgi:hypothetical protein
MKKILAVALVLSFASRASASVLTFEELENGADPTGYGGLSWKYGLSVVANQNMLIRDLDSFRLGWEGSGYANGFTSGDTAITRGGGLITQIDALTIDSFDFTGGYFTSGWVTQDITFSGWRDGDAPLFSGAYTIDTSGPLWIELNWLGIDRLVITQTNSGQSNQWMIDDFTYTPVPVPVPPAVWLFVSALGLLGWMRRKAA